MFWRLVCALMVASTAAQAQYPAKAVRVVVPFPAGSSTDIITRVLAQSVSQSIGQSVVVDNKAGADGAIAAGAFGVPLGSRFHFGNRVGHRDAEAGALHDREVRQVVADAAHFIPKESVLLAKLLHHLELEAAGRFAILDLELDRAHTVRVGMAPAHDVDE